MPEPTTQKKLEDACIENCNPRTLLRLLQHDESEALDRLKKAADLGNFKSAQGEMRFIDRYIDILTKATS
jgi:hypothetical protein